MESLIKSATHLSGLALKNTFQIGGKCVLFYLKALNTTVTYPLAMITVSTLETRLCSYMATVKHSQNLILLKMCYLYAVKNVFFMIWERIKMNIIIIYLHPWN